MKIERKAEHDFQKVSSMIGTSSEIYNSAVKAASRVYGGICIRNVEVGYRKCNRLYKPRENTRNDYGE